ncbi:hypothetical protein ACVOMS_35180 (plasmid) [Bradyrhizobium guangxiense]
MGVALRAGLLAALKPRKRVFPLRAAIPDANGPNPRTTTPADPIRSSFTRIQTWNLSMRLRDADDLECFEWENSQSSLGLVIRGTKYVRFFGRPCFR